MAHLFAPYPTSPDRLVVRLSGSYVRVITLEVATSELALLPISFDFVALAVGRSATAVPVSASLEATPPRIEGSDHDDRFPCQVTAASGSRIVSLATE